MQARRLGAASLGRLLGAWRGTGRHEPAYRQLAGALRLLILDGRVPLGVRLPGERDLAGSLGLSRTSIGAAYGILRDEGFLMSRQGSGSVASLPGERAERPTGRSDAGDAADVIEFSMAALPAGPAVHQAYQEALRALPAYLPGIGYDPVGLSVLREAVAERYTSRGLPTAPHQIFVTQGAQQGLALMLDLLAAPGDRIVVDHPTFPVALDAIQRASCRVVPVPLPAEGWDVGALAAAFRQAGPRFAYLLPDFHNPTGRYMDEETRAAVAEAAARTRTILVIDETMADLWFDHPPARPFASYDRHAQVVTLGSTGKSYWGGLRVGWVRADPATVAALARVRASLDFGTPVLEQLAAVSLLAQGEGSLDRRRGDLRRRRDHLLEIAGKSLPDWKLERPAGGLSLWAELPIPISTRLAAAAEGWGVRIAAGTRFGIDGAFERYLRLPFSLPEDRLDMAVKRLARAWAQVTPAPSEGWIDQGAGHIDRHLV